MSEITMKTIESLPMVEEPVEGASLVGWNEGRTVRMPVDAVGGSKNIVFTVEYLDNGGAPVSTMESSEAPYSITCNYDFDSFWELYRKGASVIVILVFNAWNQISSNYISKWEDYSTAVGSAEAAHAAPTYTKRAYFVFRLFSGDEIEIDYTDGQLSCYLIDDEE